MCELEPREGAAQLCLRQSAGSPAEHPEALGGLSTAEQGSWCSLCLIMTVESKQDEGMNESHRRGT